MIYKKFICFLIILFISLNIPSVLCFAYKLVLPNETTKVKEIVKPVNKNYKVSATGKEFIKKQERFSPSAYWDSNAYSIGYGHHGKDVSKNMKISLAKANKLFDQDIKESEKMANEIINSLPYSYSFSQGFFDGLCSLVYNCGKQGVMHSLFYKRLCTCRVNKGKMNDSDFKFTIAAVKQCRISSPGHIQRRYEEHLLMLN